MTRGRLCALRLIAAKSLLAAADAITIRLTIKIISKGFVTVVTCYKKLQKKMLT